MGLFRKKQAADQVIDLRDPTPERRPEWGSPLPCFECGGRGYLDHIDPFKEIMYLHCTVCGSKYDVAKADLDRIEA